MPEIIAGIIWDDGNRDHCQKHGVALVDIDAALRSPLYVVGDPGHSQTEHRLRAIGRTASGRHIFLVYTLRKADEQTYIRPISARFMHRREIEAYEQAISAARHG